MSISYATCRMNNCQFKSEDKDEKVWDSHYQTQHGISIYNDCRECGERFIAAWRGFTSEQDMPDGEDKVFHETVCDDCAEDNPLEKLFVEEPKQL